MKKKKAHRVLRHTFLFYFYQFVRLQAQPPFRMLHHASHSFRSIAARTGLQEKVSGRKRFIYGNILSFVHYLHLIHTGNAQCCTLLGRASHPVYIIRQGMRTVRFDTDILPHPVQAVHKFTVNPERRLSTRQYHRHRRIFPHFRQDFLIGHQHTLFVLRIAKRTFQVATGKTHKNSRSTRMKALSLQAVKYFVNLPHKRSCQSSS